MNNGITYKKVKINWWVFIFFGGFFVFMIFAYIHKWGNNPLKKPDLILVSIIWLFIFIFLGRFKVIINDKYVIFRSDIWIPVKIPISMIKSVSEGEAPFVSMIMYISSNACIKEKNTVKYFFDFSASHAVKIQTKNGKVYKIAIKDAEIIKEEIEKRMLQPNKYSAE